MKPSYPLAPRRRHRGATAARRGLPATGRSVMAWSGLALALLVAGAGAAEPSPRRAIRLPAVFGDRMVLQRGMEVPVYRGMAREGSRVRLSFDHVDGGLEAEGGALTGFAVAGEDRELHWAEARIEGETVVVWSDRVSDPVAVRYGWAANPRCNLYNAAGLPAAPFRTDDWPGVTGGGGGE